MSAQVLVYIEEAPGEKIGIGVEPVLNKGSTSKEKVLANLLATFIQAKVEEGAMLDKKEGGAK